MFFLFFLLSACAAPMQPHENSLPKMVDQEPMLNLKMEYEKLNYNIRKWENVKKDLDILIGSNNENKRDCISFFNRLRIKLGLPEVKPWLLEIKAIRKAFADRTMPYVDEQIQVLEERISKTEKDIQEQSLGFETEQIVKDEYVEVLQPQIQADIDNEIDEQFVKITQDEILQILEEQNINWDDYETVPEMLEQIFGEWLHLTDGQFIDIL